MLGFGTDLDWGRLSKCKGDPIEHWVDDGVREDAPLTTYQELTCGMCPVRGECLDYATKNDVDGVWGGTNSYQRRVMQVPRNRVKCPGCGSRDVIDLNSEQVCSCCGVSWPKVPEL